MDKVIQASVKEALIQVGLMNVQNGGNIKQTLNLVGWSTFIFLQLKTFKVIFYLRIEGFKVFFCLDLN